MSNPTPAAPPLVLPVIPQATLHTLDKFAADLWAVVEADSPQLLAFLSSLNLKGEQAIVAEANAENPYEGMLASAIGGVLLRLMGSKEQAIVAMLLYGVNSYLTAHEA